MDLGLSPWRVAVFTGSFFALWAGAWLVELAVADRWGLSGGSLREPAYWAIAKFLIWVVFPVVYWGGRQAFTRAGVAGQAAFIGLRRDTAGQGLRVGLIATAIWVALSLASRASGGVHLVPVGLVGLYAFLLTPIFEEILFRGYLQSTLVALGIWFWPVNVIGAVLFLLIHCLGWAFQGVLAGNLLSPHAASIVVISLVLGYVRHRSGSLLASILLHVGNNALATVAPS
ncbi:CPBP family intramembrane metalloprotease [Streptosporangiaceae bacterium NEAU-GS5]|nr:CPBP family intramembrane metalloprotease [Streptosporangiaceae bacterium NEAU-GS5]